MLAVLAIATLMSLTSIGKMEPSYAQPTFDAPSSPDSTPDASSPTETGPADDEGNFQQFMQCLFEGEASEEDISNILDGSSDSTTPTEKEIRDCFAPLYNTGGTTGTTATAGSGSADETDDSSPSENEEDEDSNTDSETSDNE